MSSSSSSHATDQQRAYPSIPSSYEGNLPPERGEATPTTAGAAEAQSITLRGTPELMASAATRNFEVQSQMEARKPTLSRMTFFRDAIRVRGSCLPRILPSVLGIVLWSAAIYIADTYCGRHWSSSATIVAPLSVVVGLLLVFRNATSYDRWYEGRKLWASTTAEAGMLARYLWANVQVDVVSSDQLMGRADGSGTADGGPMGGSTSAAPTHLAVTPHAPDNMSHHRVSTPSIFGRVYDMSNSEEPTRPSSAAGASASTSRSGADDAPTPINHTSEATSDSAAAAQRLPPPSSRQEPTRVASQEDISRRIEKKRQAIRLLILFTQSLAHELRGERGIDWLDYQDVLPADLRTSWFQQTRDLGRSGGGEDEDDKSDSNRGRESLSPISERHSGDHGQDEQTIRIGNPLPSGRDRQAANEDEDVTVPATWPFVSWYLAWRARRSAQGTGSQAPLGERTPLLPTHANDAALRASTNATHAGMGLSLLALYQLGRYVASARKAGMLNDAGPAGTSLANNMIQVLSQGRASLDRIACTTIPLVYGIHLKQCTLLYLLALPLTLVSELGWKSVPFTGLVAVTLLGLEGISSEVEMPFGDDQSDHNLALWVAQFRMEVEGLLAELDEGADVGMCL